MPKFRKKPVVIEAVEWTGENTLELGEWAGPAAQTWAAYSDYTLRIPTLEGDHIASRGDMIIRGVKGEFYPCKPDIFAATYEAVP
jgi:hypothetical protein